MSVHSMFEIIIASLFEHSFDLTHFQNRHISPLEQSFVLSHFRNHTDYKKKPGANNISFSRCCFLVTRLEGNNMYPDLRCTPRVVSPVASPVAPAVIAWPGHMGRDELRSLEQELGWLRTVSCSAAALGIPGTSHARLHVLDLQARWDKRYKDNYRTVFYDLDGL